MNYNILDFKIDTLIKSNKYSKIIDGQDKIIAISKDKSGASYIDILNNYWQKLLTFTF